MDVIYILFVMNLSFTVSLCIPFDGDEIKCYFVSNKVKVCVDVSLYLIACYGGISWKRVATLF